MKRKESLKQKIRRSMLERLKQQRPTTRNRKSRMIEKKLFQKREFRKARVVLFYVSLPEEVNTHRMIRRALRLGKRVAVPRLENRHIRPVEIRDMSRDLAPGHYGIPEPKRRKTLRTVRPHDIDLVIAPGLAFDARGNRLGRGGGYYDRFLKRLKGRIPVIGLAFRLQRLPALPTSSRDLPVSTLIAA